jgi:predicted dehydrogenase
LRFDFARMNELDFYNQDAEPAVQGWTTIDVTRAGGGHPYIEAWWPDGHGLGYEHSFVNQARDILTVLGGGEPAFALPDFADALKTQRVLHAAVASARDRAPVDVADV